MTNGAPTVQDVALQLLRYVGIEGLPQQPASSLLDSASPGALWEVASSMTAAMQEIFKRMPSQSKEYPLSAMLHAPTIVYLSGTYGSNTVAFTSGWQSWMTGCTIRIAGDDQDNEIVNATTIVLPFVGSTGGNIQATVFGDAVALDQTVAKIIGPVTIPNQYPLYPCTDRMDFIRWSAWPLVVDSAGMAMGSPFFNFIRKSIQRPRAWFVEGIYNPDLTYTQRRLRFAPMPDTVYPMGFRVAMNPPRYTIADIQLSSGTSGAVVSGAGSAADNAVYNYTGVLNSKNYYTSASGGTIVWNAGAWLIYPNGSATPDYASQDDVEFPWEVTTWQLSGGVAPVPASVAQNNDDPGTPIPLPDQLIESGFLPVALHHYSTKPGFKNAELRPSIEENYKLALEQFDDSVGQVSLTEGSYV